MSYRRGFTLVELLIAMTIFSVVMIVVIEFYLSLVRVKRGLEGKQLLIETSYAMLEKMQTEIKDYTIDYEEYFNRRLVGCSSQPLNPAANDFRWDVGTEGYCSRDTGYGNKNGFLGGSQADNHQLYFCSSALLAQENNPRIYPGGTDVLNARGCFETANVRIQSFGQYRAQFLDVMGDVDTVVGSFGDDDDRELGRGPLAIGANTGVQELYLISKTNDKRLMLRRARVGENDIDNDGQFADYERLYTIQMLRLQGFDVGDSHSLATLGSGQYDGLIDTWACDTTQGFFCQGDEVGGPYAAFRLPRDRNDGWVNMFSNNITVSNWSMEISPAISPLYAFADENVQIAPFIRLTMQTKLYGDFWFTSLGKKSIDNYALTVQTSFAISQFSEPQDITFPVR
ncbi:MAG: prepilin-type N-terminal cleavage/methylation domain-containing protein [Candidatus Absconditabacterales bacterium]|nr:prepilin-type N-terminal cleavage/methylation domain-containing protein [Candidatus Absconditabacterales bacterium]